MLRARRGRTGPGQEDRQNQPDRPQVVAAFCRCHIAWRDHATMFARAGGHVKPSDTRGRDECREQRAKGRKQRAEGTLIALCSLFFASCSRPFALCLLLSAFCSLPSALCSFPSEPHPTIAARTRGGIGAGEARPGNGRPGPIPSSKAWIAVSSSLVSAPTANRGRA
jgi:hypothetical protein